MMGFYTWLWDLVYCGDLCTLIECAFFACCIVRFWHIVADTPALDFGMHCQPQKLCARLRLLLLCLRCAVFVIVERFGNATFDVNFPSSQARLTTIERHGTADVSLTKYAKWRGSLYIKMWSEDHHKDYKKLFLLCPLFFVLFSTNLIRSAEQ